MSKQLKFDPIEVPRRDSCALMVRSVHGCKPYTTTRIEIADHFTLATSSETAALIAALHVAHKAQLEAETLTFADLKPGEWFKWATNSRDAVMKIDERTVMVPSNIPALGWNEMKVVVPLTALSDGSRVIRVRAEFHDEVEP